jgi:mannosyltransferase OCH1-like enzyme
MRTIVKLNENDLKLIIKKVIKEQYEYNPDRLYRKSSIVSRLRQEPKYLQKYIKDLPNLSKEGSDEIFTKIPQVVWQVLFSRY